MRLCAQNTGAETPWLSGVTFSKGQQPWLQECRSRGRRDTRSKSGSERAGGPHCRSLNLGFQGLGELNETRREMRRMMEGCSCAEHEGVPSLSFSPASSGPLG